MTKILVIEDCAETRNLFLESLEAEGFYAIDTQNGLVGIQRAQEHLPDLVISDIMMPQLDGYDVLTTLRTDPVIAIIPFIFVTDKAVKAEIRKGMALGADDYLTKPCTVDELLRVIAARLEKHTALLSQFAASVQVVPEPSPTDTTSITALETIFPSVPQLREVFDFIEANYPRPITLADVAQAVGYSRSYLTQVVRQQTGKTVYRWIIERRMAEACSLLLKTNQTVSQIAEVVGYQDAAHFFRQFRRLHKCTPQVWRKLHQNQYAFRRSG